MKEEQVGRAIEVADEAMRKAASRLNTRSRCINTQVNIDDETRHELLGVPRRLGGLPAAELQNFSKCMSPLEYDIHDVKLYMDQEEGRL
jgi:hypothetical protein